MLRGFPITESWRRAAPLASSTGTVRKGSARTTPGSRATACRASGPFSCVNVRVASWRSVRKKATSIIKSTLSKESHAVTSSATLMAMPRQVISARTGFRPICLRLITLSCERPDTSRLHVPELR